MAAAAALLRSVARRAARAPPPLPRPRLHGSGAAGYEDGRGNRFVSGMAAAAGLPSLASRMARAPPPPPHHRVLQQRGLQTRTSNKQSVPTSITFAYFLLFATGGVMFWHVLPTFKELRDDIIALRAKKETLIKAVQGCQTIHNQILLKSNALGQGKESDGEQSS